MHVLYATDENYVRHAAASMVSLMESNTAADELIIHVMDLNITDSSIEQLHALAGRYGRQVVIHSMGDIYSWFDFSVSSGGFGAATLARLFVARVLDESISRILYIDCDTVVTDDLSPLFRMDMTGYCLGMVPQPTANKARRKMLGMPDDKPYCNAGILLINMDQWRATNAEKRVLDFFASFGGRLPAPDQDALNGALCQQIIPLQARYNYGSVQIYYPWRAQRRISAPTPFPSQQEYTEAVAKPAIVHFLGEERPWREGNHHPYTPEYIRCLNKTPWKDVPPEQGWKTYFHCFYLFSTMMKPFPYLRWRIIDALIPAFLHYREKQKEKAHRQ